MTKLEPGQAILTEQAWLIKDFTTIRPKENFFPQEQNGQSRAPVRVANQNTGFVPVLNKKFKDFSRTHFPYFKDSIQFKKSLNSMSFLVLPQHR